MSTFLTISSTSEGLYKEKGSRFLAFAYPVSTEEEIKETLAVLRKDHPKARHFCYAYRLGADKANFKYSDDGEPHNSAGFPIFGQIKSFDLTNILVVVIRYFGGTKLGVAGLTSAYKESAHDALKNAVIVEDIERENITIKTDYARLSDLMNFIKEHNIRIVEQDLSSDCRIVISVPKDDANSIKTGLERAGYLPLNQ